MSVEATNDLQGDKTLPPVSRLRHETATDLIGALPPLAGMLALAPAAGEVPAAFLERLRAGPVPEDGIVLTAYAVVPAIGIWWGYECLRSMPAQLDTTDHKMMELVADWSRRPTAEARHRTMREALFAPARTPGVYLGLSVGWSGGSFAPNDPTPVPPWRSPRAIAAAVLTCIARCDPADRPARVATMLDNAERLLRS